MRPLHVHPQKANNIRACLSRNRFQIFTWNIFHHERQQWPCDKRNWNTWLLHSQHWKLRKLLSNLIKSNKATKVIKSMKIIKNHRSSSIVPEELNKITVELDSTWLRKIQKGSDRREYVCSSSLPDDGNESAISLGIFQRKLIL